VTEIHKTKKELKILNSALKAVSAVLKEGGVINKL
jgi:hypothetical protein